MNSIITAQALTHVIGNINWILLSISIILAFGLGAVWYSLMFFKMWKRVFNVKPDAQEAGALMRALILQFISGIFLSIVFFILTGFSVWLAVSAVIAIAALQVCNLAFKYGDMKTFLQSCTIEAGYTFVAGSVYITFALI